jgi:hypothetical protein
VQTKSFSDIEIKSIPERRVRAIIASFNCVDHDLDVTEPTEIAPGQTAVVSAFGHSAVKDRPRQSAGVVWTGSKVAGIDAQYFDTAAGNDAFTMVRELHSSGPLEWSYGFQARRERGHFQGKSVNYLRDVKIHEVSPVAVAAGMGTGTLSAKSADRLSYGSQFDHLPAALAEAVAAASFTLARLDWKERQEMEDIHLGLIRDQNQAALEELIRDDVAAIAYLRGF